MPFGRGAGSITYFETFTTLGDDERRIEAIAVPVDGSEEQGSSDRQIPLSR
jgi:hypothetical protein